MPLTDIPTFAGGAHLGDSSSGVPSLKTILEEHKAAIEAGTVGMTDLASTANAKGASLIGIEDALSLYAAATVEAALAEKLTGLRVADVADDAVLSGVPVIHVVDIADGVTADKDVVCTDKFEVTDVVVIKKVAAGGASDTLAVKNGATAITNAMDINVADKTVVRAGTIDDAQSVIAAGGTLRVTKTKASAANVACRVEIHGIRRA